MSNRLRHYRRRDVLVLRMYFSEFSDYEMANHVVEYELNRRITWEPRRRDVDQPVWKHRRRQRNDLTEIFDCARWPNRSGSKLTTAG